MTECLKYFKIYCDGEIELKYFKIYQVTSLRGLCPLLKTEIWVIALDF